jgi:hypothetical protein
LSVTQPARGGHGLLVIHEGDAAGILGPEKPCVRIQDSPIPLVFESALVLAIAILINAVTGDFRCARVGKGIDVVAVNG